MADPIIIRIVDAGPQGVPGPRSWAAPQPWQATTAYVAAAPASVVNYLDVLYLCIDPHTSGVSFDEDYWLPIVNLVPTLADAASYTDEQVATRLAKSGGTMTGALTLAADPVSPLQAATKQYADALIAANDAMIFKGVIDCSGNPNYPAADRGRTYRVSVGGKIGGASGANVEAGDILLCLTDGTASGNQATVGASWSIIQTNIDGAVTLTGAQTLTNKTLTAPAISSPTGLVKADVGLGNVDNTSDATKNAAAATLTNKTLTAPVINSPTGLVKANVGLGNVDDTSDANKPVSTAQATALATKFDKSGGNVTGDVNLQGDTTSQGAFPGLRLNATGGAANERRWDIFSDGANLQIRTVNDAYSAAAAVMAVVRSGITVVSVALGAPVIATGDLLFSLGNSTVRWVTAFLSRLTLVDGVSEPATLAGHVQIYVDSADGDLKAKFGDGSVKTIVTDT